MRISTTIMKIILYLLTLYLIYRLLSTLPHWLRFLLKSASKKGKESPRGEAHDMVPCFRCGTYVSRETALSDSGRCFCGEKCRLLITPPASSS